MLELTLLVPLLLLLAGAALDLSRAMAEQQVMLDAARAGARAAARQKGRTPDQLADIAKTTASQFLRDAKLGCDLRKLNSRPLDPFK
jgi:Flp pilus assembly protein TadG